MLFKCKQFRLASVFAWFLVVAIILGSAVTFRQGQAYKSEARMLIDSYVQKQWLTADLQTYSTKHLGSRLWRINCKSPGLLFLKNADTGSYTPFNGQCFKGEGVLEFSRMDDEALEGSIFVDGKLQCSMILTSDEHEQLMSRIGLRQGSTSDNEVMVLEFQGDSGVVLRRCD